jgi:hypothetical protein
LFLLVGGDCLDGGFDYLNGGFDYLDGGFDYLDGGFTGVVLFAVPLPDDPLLDVIV